MPDKAKKVCVITGAGSGLGRTVARRMAERCAVAIGDVDLEGAEETARLIKAEGGVCLVRRTDVTRADDVRGLIDETVNTFGRLDYAVNNAAIEGARIGDHAAEARRLSIALQKSK